MHKLEGNWKGARVRIHFPERRGVGERVPTALLTVGDTVIRLDDNMPAAMHRAMPVPIARASNVEDWRAFLVAAVLWGKL